MMKKIDDLKKKWSKIKNNKTHTVKKATIKFKPFSKKQKKVLTWWNDNSPAKDKDGIIADGAIRSGKTISMSLSYIIWAMSKFNGQNFGMAGKTIGSFRRNVLFWLKLMLKARNYQIQDKRADNLLVVSKGNITNYFYIFGGKDERSQDLIQGITLAGMFFDEVALMPESFVNQATGRCSVEGSKWWFNCNPGAPFHWFKKNWIDKVKEKNLLYLHFTMDDNLSLSEKIKNRYKSMYAGVFYLRYILGQWAVADGAVYPMFNPEVHAVEIKRNWTRIFIAGDFGIQNATTFGIFGYYAPEKRYHQIASYYHNGREEGQKTVKEYVADLKNFIRENMVMPEYITIDPSAAALIVELRKDTWFSRHNIRIIPAKNNVEIGIQLVSYLLNINKLTLDPNCTYDIEEFSSYVWDSDKLDKGKEEVVKLNDHAMDKIRYAIMTDSKIHRTLDRALKLFSGKGTRE
ncbi:PBSX family phage terminase large subunit [Terrisporobacter hibernicus]|nr:PBSX family phage terminase large subunit [Terrisporobacter hibernicus]